MKAPDFKPELDFLKFLAIILITNSHLSHFYPIPALGTGGSLGNSIFFFISAIGITLSLKGRNQEFFLWYRKRFMRIYPVVWIVVIMLTLFGFYSYSFTLGEIWTTYIFPTPYWFIPAMMLFYIPTYFISRTYSKSLLTLVIALAGIFYFVAYYLWVDKTVWSIEADSYFKWIFYFIVMMFGIEAGYNYDSYTFRKKDLLILGCFTAGYFGIKVLLSKNILMEYQFMLHLITLPWIYFLLRSVKAPLFQKALSSNPAHIIVAFIASITLEIYLFQRFFYKQELINKLGFPLNLLLFTVVVLISSWFLHTVYNYKLSKTKK